jgi:hypothetical protein
MNKKKMLEEILQENRQVNRNLVHLGNLIGLLILLEGIKEGKKRRDKGMIGLAKLGLVLVSVLEAILTALNIQDIYAKYKEEKEEDELWG